MEDHKHTSEHEIVVVWEDTQGMPQATVFGSHVKRDEPEGCNDENCIGLIWIRTDPRRSLNYRGLLN